MELANILMSQAIRFFADAGPVTERRSPVPLIKDLQDKYGFVEVPRTVADLDFTKGVTFLRGYYKGKIIEKLQIYQNGLLCEAMEDNSVTDEFLGELLHWAATQHDLPVKETGVRAYVSQLEVTTTIDIEAVVPKINAIGALLAGALQSYGQPVPDYKINGIKMHYDSMTTPVPRAPEFVFERRAGQLYSTNQFFTSAPLRTKDHMYILGELEKLWK
jgi:hypothetical protein